MWKRRRILTWFFLLLGVSSFIRAGVNFERASSTGPFAEKLALALIWLGLGAVVLVLSQHVGRDGKE